MRKFLLLLPILFSCALIVFAFYPEKESPPIKVGILHSLTGTMAISEKPVMQATLLAIEEINAQGGLLGRQIEPVIIDGKSDWDTFAKQAEYLITQEKVRVIFGCWTSASRKRVRPIVEKYHHLLFYPVQYEGLETSPNIIYMGAAPNQQIIPAVSWSIRNFGSRIYLIGSDYVFPRVASWLIHKQTPLLDGAIIGEHYMPLGATDMTQVIADLKQLKPDVVINSINGDSNIAFFSALQKASITASDIPVMSLSIGEAELSKIHKSTNIQGHYAAWNYFQSINTPENHKFVQAYQSHYGKNLPVSDPMEAAWNGVHLWSQAVLSAQTDDTATVRQTVRHQSFTGPEGIVSIDNRTQHTWKTARIGQIQENGQFKILWSSTQPIRPMPYPALVSVQEADQYLKQLYLGWHKHWASQTTHAKPAKQGQP
ncbi:urea ABC transporter substrate-binding protein [Ghiorsea bivora]|uniref:urea ABC transporter substrate-binding protein n=1 Tax=Ghiorsea bivora TaxID=1485545 RepID=UPI000570F522|nr:urea ABC transporter substrate-binding protein [Ghiorsea bivora]